VTRSSAGIAAQARDGEDAPGIGGRVAEPGKVMSGMEAIKVNRCGSATAKPAGPDACGEQALIAAAQAGNADAMDALLIRHRKSMYRAARRFTKSHEDAEDLVQGAMLRAFINIQKFRRESQFVTWLIAIVNNAGLSMKRREKRVCWLSLDGREDELGNEGFWDTPDDRPNPEEETAFRELLRILNTSVMRQSETRQTLLKECAFNGLHVSDVAASLGVTVVSAKSSLCRARRRLFDSFLKRGIVKRRNLPKMMAR
jgi:RNA polymerase sigma-70 factor (ECF subfamily)